MSNKWTHKVVKMARGNDGKYFDFSTAATFDSEAEALKYAEQFARHQAGVAGARITVRTRANQIVGGYSIPNDPNP